MPRFIDFPWLLPLWFVVVAVLFTGFLIVRRGRRQVRVPLTTGGPIVVATEEGVLLRGSFLTFPVRAESHVSWTSIGTHDGAGDENWFFGGLRLRADGAVFTVSTVEYFAGGFDMRVTVHDTWTGAALFSATDNSHPTTVWRGDETDIPALLHDQQAILDAEWREWQQVDPDVARPVLQAIFGDPDSSGELSFGGWTAAGHCLLNGRSMLMIYWDEEEHWLEPAPWWGVAGPAAGGRWGWIEKGFGTPPPMHSTVPTPPLARRVTLVNGQLLVDGVVQANLAAGVLDFDGPFA
jgi:hypothetical protein